MTKNFKIILFLCFAAFFILGMFLVSAINNLSFNYSGSDLYNNINEEYLAQRIAEEFFNRQESLFDDVEADYRLLTDRSLTAELVVTATPRAFAEGAEATLFLGELSAAMALENGQFVGRIEIPLGETTGADTYRIQLQEGEQYRSQSFALEENEGGFAPGWEVFVFSHHRGGAVYDPEKGYLFEDNFTLTDSLLPFGEEVVSCRIFLAQDGKEIYSEPMQDGYLEVSRHFKLEPGAEQWLTADVVCESGSTYRYLLVRMERNEDGGVIVNAANAEPELMPASALQMITPEGETIDLPVYKTY